MKAFGWLALATCMACSGARVTAIDTTNGDPLVSGPLRLEVKDFPAQPGILWALPSITPGTGTVVVQNTRYGSLCVWAVSGNAVVQGARIDLHIGFSARLTSCTADVRALQYTATITAPAGTYDVTVIHHEGAQADTLQKQKVTVH